MKQNENILKEAFLSHDGLQEEDAADEAEGSVFSNDELREQDAADKDAVASVKDDPREQGAGDEHLRTFLDSMHPHIRADILETTSDEDVQEPGEALPEKAQNQSTRQ